jgi:hypothetical protein
LPAPERPVNHSVNPPPYPLPFFISTLLFAFLLFS